MLGITDCMAGEHQTIGSPIMLPRVETSPYAINPMSVIGERVVIAMVGLPARGKSYTSKAIVHFFTFLGCPVKLFNAGNKRRTKGLAGAAANFFDHTNKDAQLQREQLAMETLDALMRIKLLGPAQADFDPVPVVEEWLEGGTARRSLGGNFAGALGGGALS